MGPLFPLFQKFPVQSAEKVIPLEKTNQKYSCSIGMRGYGKQKARNDSSQKIIDDFPIEHCLKTRPRTFGILVK